MYDVIIIGCGPAGMTAAIYLLRSGKNVLILEKEGVGGQIASSPLVENYPGFMSISGMELSNNFYEQVISLGGKIELEAAIEIKNENPKIVITENNQYKAKAVIVATGAKYRMIGIEREEEFIGNGISFCTACDGAFFKGKVVAVIGGRNTAITNAIFLSTICKKVYLIHRNENFKCEKLIFDKLKEKSNVEILMNYNVTKLIGNDCLEKIIITSNKDEKTLDLDGMFVSIGHLPQNELIKNLLNLSKDEYIESNENCETNIEGIFACGDIRDKEIRQLTTAVSDGTICGINANKYIEKM